MVTEIIPRVRALHSNWEIDDIEKLVKQKSHPRISGWLFFDPDYLDQVGKSRGTIWKVHPIMQMEVEKPGGGWTELP